MTALPVEHDDPLDPVRILADLPGREHDDFLRAYAEAHQRARDPDGWAGLRRTLRVWRAIATAAARPGFYEAQDAALAGTGAGMLLEDYIRMRRDA